MICDPCKDAGNQARDVVRQPPEVRGGAAAGQLEDAMAGHARCRGGTWCDCRHAEPKPSPPRRHEAGSD
jgi:hypothetical protein